MACVSWSRLGRGSLTPFRIIFFRSEMNCSVSQKVYTEVGQAPTYQARSREADHLRPNLAARTLRSVEHTPSKFGHDPCPVRRGFVAAVKCCERKACSGQALEQNQRSQSLMWVSIQYHKGENLCCFLFPNPIIVDNYGIGNRKQSRVSLHRTETREKCRW